MWNLKRDFTDPNKRKIFGGVLDETSMYAIYKLSTKGILEKIYGVMKSGKESSVLLGEDKNGKKLAVKIYAIEASNFKRMYPYLKGDPRFGSVKKNKRSIIFAWCQKEFKNLQRVREADVPCPEPIAFLKNVLVMSFIGEDKQLSPRLSQLKLRTSKKLFNQIIKDIRKLYKKAKIVHGDLSEYNILVKDGKGYLIDFSQSVLLSHPNADIFLKRDIKNVLKYFKKSDLEEEIYEEVTK